VLWGDTNGIDGMEGHQPRHTHIRENIFRELGIIEKQASGIFQAKTCQTHIKGMFVALSRCVLFLFLSLVLILLAYLT
jgi:hypothetical protein